MEDEGWYVLQHLVSRSASRLVGSKITRNLKGAFKERKLL